MTETDVLESGIRRKSELASHNLRNEHFSRAAAGTAGSGTLPARVYFITRGSSQKSGLEIRAPVQFKST